MMDFLFLLTGIGMGALVMWLFARAKSTNQERLSGEEYIRLDKEKSILAERTRFVESEKEKYAAELTAEREKLSTANSRLAKAEEAFKNMNEKLALQKAEMEDLQIRFTKEFENLANKILDEKSKKFTEQNKTNLDTILSPLKEKIKEFEEKVDKTYKAESAERISLKTEIKYLVDLNKQLGEEANNLTKALKGDSKKQGDWGEIMLEKILERSGLLKDREYRMQVNTQNEEGSRIQPDVVIDLPDNKHIVVDSKVSLSAYTACINEEDKEAQAKLLTDHLVSVRRHVKGLSEKNYHTSSDFGTPDFVLLFMPIEAAFSLAVQSDPDLFAYAWDRKIVIVSPSTLFATLRTIASVWTQERQTRNVLEIAKQSGMLYDKFAGFVEDLLAIGKKMNDAKASYDEAMKKLSTGSGNLVGRAEAIKKLGAKAGKSLPPGLLEKAGETD